MDSYISKNAILDQLQEMKTGLEREHKRVAASTVQACMNTVIKAQGKVIRYEPETSVRTIAVEAWYPGAQTGREVMRCGFCTTQVTRRDKYCSFCGRKLVDE